MAQIKTIEARGGRKKSSTVSMPDKISHKKSTAALNVTSPGLWGKDSTMHQVWWCRRQKLSSQIIEILVWTVRWTQVCLFRKEHNGVGVTRRVLRWCFGSVRSVGALDDSQAQNVGWLHQVWLFAVCWLLSLCTLFRMLPFSMLESTLSWKESLCIYLWPHMRHKSEILRNHLEQFGWNYRHKMGGGASVNTRPIHKAGASVVARVRDRSSLRPTAARVVVHKCQVGHGVSAVCTLFTWVRQGITDCAKIRHAFCN